jgi:hypothetical protein
MSRNITSAHTVRAFVTWLRELTRSSLTVVDQAGKPVVLRVTNEIELAGGSWTQWQESVVALLREDFPISFDEVDWEAWRGFYEQGKSPKAAVNRALERDY